MSTTTNTDQLARECACNVYAIVLARDWEDDVNAATPIIAATLRPVVEERDQLRAALDAAEGALKVLAAIPVEDFGKQNKPDYPLHGWNGHYINVSHVIAARQALAHIAAIKNGGAHD